LPSTYNGASASFVRQLLFAAAPGTSFLQHFIPNIDALQGPLPARSIA
jgi:hypothetical protein